MNIFFSALFRYKEKKSPDVLGLYPERVHINAIPERRYLWTSRIMVIFCILSICITIMLSMCIYLLLPQKNASPIFYQTNLSSSLLEKTQKAEASITAQNLLTEELIHKYIKLRHSVPSSNADLIYRWDKNSEFFQLSSIGEYQRFIYKMNYDQIVSFISQNMVRKVEIDWAKQITNKLWQVQFRTITTTNELTKPQTIIWKSYLRIDYIDIKNNPEEEEGVRSFDYTHNPYGFRVINYYLGYAGMPQSSEHYLEVAKNISTSHN